MIRVIPDINKIRTLYLFHYLANPLVKTHFIRKYVTGATIKGISQKNLENIKILVPPIKMQDKFIKAANSLSEFLEKSATHEKGVVNLFFSLSQKAFAGEL